MGPRDGEAVYLKTAERTGIGRGLDARNPVFDQSIDFLVDGDLAHAESTVIGVELWCTHVVIRPSFKGAVVIPLADVLKTGQLHDTFHLEGGKGGRLELKMEWLWTAANQF